MKKTIFLILIFIISNNAFGQENSSYSIELNSNYIFYFVANPKYSVNYKNFFNCGFSLFGSQYLNDRTKLSLGINYSTKYFYYTQEPTLFNDFFTKQEYLIKYINIPILISYNFFKISDFKIGITSGFFGNHIISYDINRYYLNMDTKKDKNVKAGQKSGLSYRLGLEFSKLITQRLIINISPFFDYKIFLDFDEQRPDYRNLTDDRFSTGFRLGVEYLFEKNK